jgi:hypothetical protein
MTKPDFTPGPWALTRNSARIEVRTTPKASYAFSHQDEPNARLIASAPDLYAALEECFTQPFAHCLVHEDKDALYRRICAINDVVRAVLAKARGEKGEGK